jgi:hypothetical protein
LSWTMQRNSHYREGETYLIVPRRFKFIEFVWVVVYFVILFLFSHLQYYNFRLRSVIYPLMWLSAAFVLYKALFERSRERRGILQLGGIIGFFVLLYYLIPLTGFCRYTDYGSSYVTFQLSMSEPRYLMIHSPGMVFFAICMFVLTAIISQILDEIDRKRISKLWPGQSPAGFRKC